MRVPQHHSNIRFTFRGKKGTIFTFKKYSAVVALFKEKKIHDQKASQKNLHQKAKAKKLEFYT